MKLFFEFVKVKNNVYYYIVNAISEYTYLLVNLNGGMKFIPPNLLPPSCLSIMLYSLCVQTKAFMGV